MIMFKMFGILSLQMINLLLFLIFLVIIIVVVGSFTKDYLFPLTILGGMLAFYLSNIITGALEKRFKLH